MKQQFKQYVKIKPNHILSLDANNVKVELKINLGKKEEQESFFSMIINGF